jgi:uncharacterized lipoprotein YddW (UPF0748 family)
VRVGVLERREFVARVGRAMAAASFLPTTALLGACRPRGARPPENWTWVHGNDEAGLEDWRGRFRRVAGAGIGGLLVSGGDLETLAAAAHAEGLQFHRWIWTLNRSGDDWVKTNHPEWFMVNRNGESSLEKPPYVGYYQWVCPTRQPVRQYLRGIVDGLARRPDIDGVHLDYIRYPDVILPVGLWEKYGLVQDREYPEFDFCYCDVCRETFKERSGVDPLDLPDPAQDAAWRRFRWDSVTGLVRELADAARARGKPTSAAVFPTPSLARKLVRQAWDEWPLDMVFPMLYHTFYEEGLAWIGESVREGRARLPAATPLYAGLYLPSLSPEALADAVRIARRAGAAGVSLFELNGLTDEHLAAVKADGGATDAR